MSLAYTLHDTGGSRSFPGLHALTQNAAAGGDVAVIIGTGAGAAYRAMADAASRTAVLIELGTECLGVHTGEDRAKEGGNALGFARYRLGDADPTNLVELVKQPATKPEALAAAKAVLEAAGLVVAVCNDFPGRILDRLLRPYFNATLRRLDEGLATAEDMDTTLRLGLGYPEGPIALLHRTGLAAHYDVTRALYEALGDPAYAPARRAQVAKQRSTP
jgi:3-hydroxybutyryl-CoA dehydrogenase